MNKRKIITLLSILLTCFSAHAQTVPALYRSVNEDKMLRWVDSVFNRMSEDERIGQFFMVVAEPSTDARNINSLVSLVNNQKIGGVLFQKGDPQSQVTVTNRIQREARIPLLIALDGEWGLSMRLSNTTRFPKNMTVGAITDDRLIEKRFISSVAVPSSATGIVKILNCIISIFKKNSTAFGGICFICNPLLFTCRQSPHCIPLRSSLAPLLAMLRLPTGSAGLLARPT